MKRSLIFYLMIISKLAFAQENEYTKYVHPLIGTDGTGHTFPGPSMPFGMVQPGPDNRESGWDYTSGYQYNDSVIIGFSQTRLNGTGICEFGDVLLQPLTIFKKDNFGETYSKGSEKAKPGYYSVQLNNKVKVELSCTDRVAFHQYTYPTEKGFLLVDIQHGLGFMTDSLVFESDVKIENNNTISGYCHTKNWVERKYFFTVQFNQPFIDYTTLERRHNDNAPRYVLSFNLTNKILQTKVALSTVSVEGAKQNMKAELPGWNFSETVLHAKNVWNTYLRKIEIEAPEKQKEIFYTSMYRLFLQPANITDVDGLYRGGDDSVRPAANKEYYSTLSLWDTYRAAHPLYTIIVSDKVNGFVRTMIAHSKAAGFLPIWAAWGKDNFCMIGNHAIPVIADAYKKGFTGFNANDALKEMIKSTTVNHINSNWTLLNKYGYYPIDSLDNEAVSRTLEHGVDDYCIAVMADRMGLQNEATIYYKRADYYKNLYDSSTHQMRGKDSNGKWRTSFNPLTATSPMNNPGDYTEANAWQYFWTPAQYDINGMMKLLGGKKKFTQQLDSFFTIKTPNPNKYLGQEAMIGQYAHGNEPSHHIAYLYAYSDSPRTGQRLIHQIINTFYNNTPDGMIGNDDCGQMSAWYILSTLGFYQINPVSNQFVLGAPQVKKATIYLPAGKKLVINAENISSQNIYTKAAYLNNKIINEPYITYQQIMNGGNLNFIMVK